MNELTYQPLDDCHAEGLFPIWSDEEVIRFTNIKSPCTLEETGGRVSRLKEFDVFAVLQNDTVIGTVGCPCMDREKEQFGLFYQFGRPVWGKGYGTLATDWLLGFMKQKYPNGTIFAGVLAENVASEKILIRFGFTLISEEPFEKNGEIMTIRNYEKKAF